MREKNTHPKVALIFGGSRGIGAAIVSRLAREGHSVAFTYLSQHDKAEGLMATVKNAGGSVMMVEADSGDPIAIASAVQRTVDSFGQLDVAVINAGILRMAPIESYSLEDLDLMLNVNIRGVVLGIQASAARMRGGGRIITIGSNLAVRTGFAGASVYGMTKAAVASLVKGVALDLAPRGITVNNIQPGPIDTDMNAGAVPQLTKLIPLKRIGKPDEVAGLVSYLIRDEAGFMTGASLTIDGGFVA